MWLEWVLCFGFVWVCGFVVEDLWNCGGDLIDEIWFFFLFI